MEREQLMAATIALAVATPLLAGLIHAMTRMGALRTLPRSRLVLIALIGPANLLLWLTLNRYLDGVGHRSVPGIALAALVFVVVGFGTGFLRGSRAPRGSSDSAEPPAERKTESQD